MPYRSASNSGEFTKAEIFFKMQGEAMKLASYCQSSIRTHDLTAAVFFG